MYWTHYVSLDWLKKRQEYLCASDAKSLVKEFAKVSKTEKWQNYKKIDEIGPKALEVIASKLEINLDPSAPSSAAARGHELEPFALGDYEQAYGGARFYHWDDRIIVDNVNMIAFSPDGLDVPEAGYELAVSIDKVHPSKMAEVKCYTSAKHIAAMYANEAELDERWQIAWGMLVCPSIQIAELIFYNPNLKACQLHVKEYTRDSLKEEIETLQGVAEYYKRCTDKFWIEDRRKFTTGYASLDEKTIWSTIYKPEEVC